MFVAIVIGIMIYLRKVRGRGGSVTMEWKYSREICKMLAAPGRCGAVAGIERRTRRQPQSPPMTQAALCLLCCISFCDRWGFCYVGAMNYSLCCKITWNNILVCFYSKLLRNISNEVPEVDITWTNWDQWLVLKVYVM